MEQVSQKRVCHANVRIESSAWKLLKLNAARLLTIGLLSAVIGITSGQQSSLCFAQSARETKSANTSLQFEGLLRITWGGASARQFRGKILLDEGQISVVQNLSLQPDSPGTVLPVGDGQLRIGPHSKATFGGIVVKVCCPLNAQLDIEILNPSAAPFEASFAVRDLLNNTQVRSIDDAGNRLAVERPVEDQLQIRTSSKSSVLETREIWPASICGNFTSLPPGKHKLLVRRKGVLPSRPAELVHETEVEVDRWGCFTDVQFQLDVPDKEGVYQLELCTASERSYLASFLPSEDEVLRRFEFVAIDTTERLPRSVQWTETQKFRGVDAATPGFLSWVSTYIGTQRIRDSVKRVTPLSETFDSVHSFGQLGERELQLPNSVTKKCLTLHPESWLAIPLTGLKAGQPNRLRIRTPVDWSNELIVSIKPLGDDESVAKFSTLGSDYKIETSARELLRHSALPREEQTGLRNTEIVFWPASEQSLLLLSNPSSGRLASVLDVALDSAEWSLEETREESGGERYDARGQARLAGVYLDKPLLGVWLGTQRTRDPVSGRLLEDWSTWHLACTRLMHYLDLLEANLLVAKVQADGGAVFPSIALQPSPQYDNGTFYSDGRNSGIKDGVALLLKHMERSKRTLVLALDLDGKLPGIEIASQRMSGLYQRKLTAGYGPKEQRDKYDPLHPEVQQHIESLVQELVNTYGNSPSFGGLQLQLTQKSMLLYGGDLWLPSERVLKQFEATTGVFVPRESTAFREFLHTPQGQDYLKWRGERVSSFLTRLASIVAQQQVGNENEQLPSDMPATETLNLGSGARLYLHAGSLWEQAPMESGFLSPSTITRTPIEFLLAYGLELSSLRSAKQIVLVQSEVEISNSVNADRWVRQISRRIGLNAASGEGLRTAAVSWQRPQAHRLPGIESLREATGQGFSDVIYPIRIESQSFLNKALLRQAVQQEPSLLALGAWLPVGAELTLLKDNLKTLRSLPPTPFQEVELAQGKDSISSSLVRVRYANVSKKSYLQIVNATPWTEEIRFSLAGANKEISHQFLAGLQLSIVKEQVSGGQEWVIRVPASRVIGLQLDQKVTVTSAARSCANGVSSVIAEELTVLEEILGASADPTRKEVAANLRGDFEQFNTSRGSGLPQGWSSSALPSVSVRPSNHLPHSGQWSLEITSANKDDVRTWLHSPDIPVPVTRRLTLQAWLRSPADQPSTLARIALVGRTEQGDRFERSLLVGSKDDPSQQIPNDWGTRPFTLDVGEMPVGNMTSLYVSIELVGSGRLWVDDVQVFHCWLHPNERTYLQGRLLVAKRALKAGDPSVAEELLDGPWARYLRRVHPDMQDSKGKVEGSVLTQGATEETKLSHEHANWNSSPSLFEAIRDSLLQSWLR